MIFRQLSEKAGLLLLGFLVLGSCGKDDPEPPAPNPDKGTLRVSAERPVATPMATFIYKADGSLVIRREEPSGTGLWSWSEELPAGRYGLLIAGTDPAEVRLADTEDRARAYAEVVPSGNDSLLASLDSPFYLEASDEVRLTNGEETAISSSPEDIRRVLRLTIDAGKGFVGASVGGHLTGIASSIRLSDRISMGVGTLRLDFHPSPVGRAGVYEAVAGILGTVVMEGAARGNVCTFSFETAAGERFGYQENLTARLAEAMATGRDTLDLALEVSPAVPIRLYTGIQTRAAVDAFDSTPVSIAVGTSAGDYTEHWTGIATDSEIELDPERYYPTDGSELFIRSYHPAAPHVDGEVHYDLTGQEDLMLTEEQRGSLASRFDATLTPLVHKHLLTQLSFKLLIANAPDNCRVRGVSLNGLAASAKISLSEGKVIPVGDPMSVGIYVDPGTGGIPLVSGIADMPGFILVQPEATFTIDLILAVDDNASNDLVFTNIPVTFEGGGGEPGNAYRVEISLELPDDPDVPDDDTDDDIPGPMDKYKVAIKATIIPWNMGNNGSADL
ncbi:hypothetical protein B5F32_11020 [Parabacteroides distasonis]|uniref:Fimbrillin family protein n=1 Tax=Parabacteroides distasonis TaxID=823 RepID=A0A1Y4IQ06_PARDI|nr:fimbrillin family protein [Parabacteroides distasonis]OUP18942.1 hypothetical protein B5F32_11020 [Parabacteroides distasonis]